MHGVKYCALGNDYWVIDSQISNVLDPQTVRRICDRHWGLGADGILWGHLINAETFGLTIFNSDGSVAEISGNGTSIFGQYLWDYNKTLGRKQFSLETSKGKNIACEIKENGIRIQLARALFCNKYTYEVPQHLIAKYGVSKTLELYSVSLGNPHCVVPMKNIHKDFVFDLGPLLENDKRFPQKTNVQFVQYIPEEQRANALIWERGSGYTLGSGSCACAVAFVFKLLYANTTPVKICMPGGTLEVSIDNSNFCSFTNFPKKVAEVTFELPSC